LIRRHDYATAAAPSVFYYLLTRRALHARLLPRYLPLITMIVDYAAISITPPLIISLS